MKGWGFIEYQGQDNQKPAGRGETAKKNGAAKEHVESTPLENQHETQKWRRWMEDDVPLHFGVIFRWTMLVLRGSKGRLHPEMPRSPKKQPALLKDCITTMIPLY